jgi:pyruvate dehydrogenase complex dehydrogenase (E1) component
MPSYVVQLGLLPDPDPAETRWLESLDAVLHSAGLQGCKALLQKLFEYARNRGLEVNGDRPSFERRTAGLVQRDGAARCIPAGTAHNMDGRIRM